MPIDFTLPPLDIIETFYTQWAMLLKYPDITRIRCLRTRRGLKLHEDGKFRAITFGEDGRFERVTKYQEIQCHSKS